MLDTETPERPLFVEKELTMKPSTARRFFAVQTSRPQRGFQLRIEDGVMDVHVAASAMGVFVQRSYAPPNRAQEVMAVLFKDAAGFGDWCDADVIRFDYPMLFIALKRDGNALFV